MHTICRFEAWEVRSLTLQTMCESELKRRSYGHLKTTIQSWAKILQLRNQPFLPKPPASTWVPLRKLKLHLHSYEPRCEITSKLWIKLQIISKLRNHKFNLQNQSSNLQNGQFKRAKFFQVMFQLEKSTYVTHIFATDSVRFFLKIFYVNFYFLLVISLRCYLDIS